MARFIPLLSFAIITKSVKSIIWEKSAENELTRFSMLLMEVKPCQLRMILFFCILNFNLNLFIAFSLWNEWSDCSLTCDFGQKTRTRICQQNCDGVSSDDLSETKSCNEFICSGEQKPSCNRCQNKNFCWFLIIRIHRTNSPFLIIVDLSQP